MKLAALYLVSVIVAGVVLAWNPQSAWVIFLLSTLVVLLSTYRSVVTPAHKGSKKKESEAEPQAQDITQGIAGLIRKGFHGNDREARLRVFEVLEEALTRRVKRELRIAESDFAKLHGNVRELGAIIEDEDLILLLTNGLASQRRSWDIRFLDTLLTKIEGWKP